MAATGTGTGFLESFSPWTSRSTTPKPDDGKAKESAAPSLSEQKGADHSIDYRHRLSLKDYPNDCPKSNIRWFYAVDVSFSPSNYSVFILLTYRQSPKRKPLPIDLAKTAKPLTPPKKYAAFSARDSRSIETAFQKLIEDEQDATKRSSTEYDTGETGVQKETPKAQQTSDYGDLSEIGRPQTRGSQGNTSINDFTSTDKVGSVKVPVNEDFLFDVNIEARELAPAYWLGPIYDVRRGSWFYQEGSSLRPCDENLAIQLEEGYLKVKPWRNQAQQSTTQPKSRPPPLNVGDDSKAADKTKDEASIPAKFELQTQRLFGAYMNHVVTFQDATTAWLLTDDFLSRMSSTVYQRFAGGGHLGGTKVIRGYSEASKTNSKKESDKAPETRKGDGAIDKSDKRSAAPKTDGQSIKDGKPREPDTTPQQEPRLLALERQLSSFSEDPALQEEERRQADEKEIEEDYKDEDGQDQGREIEHLILVTHGIGQRLGLRLESINFIHDVNVLRKTLKGVYEASPDLQALNSEVDKLPKNCRLQVLPVVWRHLLDFPKQSFKQNQKEQDLTDPDTYGDDDEYPSLENITVEGVPAIRNLITDLALDILLYQSAYREHIASIVQQECNRVYELFVQRNPNFSGKVSLIGHSLGSAILFDILSRQKEPSAVPSGLYRHKKAGQRGSSVTKQQIPELGLRFQVEDFYCLGSPLGLYQMLKGRKIAARRSLTGLPAKSPGDSDSLDDPFLGAPSQQSADLAGTREPDILSITVSSPKCQQLYNIFHPADPIAYRIEPLISRAMSSLKPQPLPYTKRGLFGVQAQGFTNIGARVGQSVSGLWSNITSGVASSLLNRSLGLTGEGQLTSSQSLSPPQIQPKPTPSAGAGSNNSVEEQNAEHPPTLIDSELETLYAGFEKRRKSHQSDESRDLGKSGAWMEADERSKRLRREEAKVRALNSNGRVDFSIQE